MSKKTIYLIRHGETNFNKQGIIQGSGIDSDLNEKGLLQGKSFCEYYAHIPFDKIYTSNLKRTVQTVQDLLNTGIPHEKLAGLNEICWGEKEGKTPNYVQDACYRKVIEQWKVGETHLPAAIGGESPDEVSARQQKALDYILSNQTEKTILITMHGRAMRILLAKILHDDLSKMDDFEHQNVCLYVLEYDYELNNFELLIANDVRHLELQTV